MWSVPVKGGWDGETATVLMSLALMDLIMFSHLDSPAPNGRDCRT